MGNRMPEAWLYVSLAALLLSGAACGEDYSRTGCAKVLIQGAGDATGEFVARDVTPVEGGWELTGFTEAESDYGTGTLFIPSHRVFVVQFDEGLCSQDAQGGAQ